MGNDAGASMMPQTGAKLAQAPGAALWATLGIPQQFLQAAQPKPYTTEDNPTGGITPKEAGDNFLMGLGATSLPFKGAIGALGSAGGKLIQPPPSIKAYHASPYDFDKFDLAKMGTGEGAQTYGHGLYFAENPLVSGRGGEYDKKFTAMMNRGLPPGKDTHQAKIYEVNINSPKDNFLDWDKL